MALYRNNRRNPYNLKPDTSSECSDDDDYYDDYVIDDWPEVDEDDDEWTCYDSSSSDSCHMVLTDGVAVRKIFVANFHSRVSKQDLKTFFSKFGNISEVTILEGRSKPFAFVTFKTPEEAYLALNATTKELQMQWCKLSVSAAYSWHQPTEINKSWCRDTSTGKVERDCHVKKLNDDCLLLIFSFLSIREQVKIERVCRKWQALSQSLWLRRSTIDLHDLQGVMGHFSMPALRKALRYCGHQLVSLDFMNVKTDGISSVLPLVSKNCTNLEVLKMTFLKVNPCIIRDFGKSCLKLRHLALHFCQGFHDSDVAQILSHFDQLEILDLSSNTHINGSFMKQLKPTTHTLILNECNNLNMMFIVNALSKKSCDLKRLSLNSCQTLSMTDLIRISTVAGKKLQHINIGGYFPRFGNDSLQSLEKFTELESISLSHNSSVSNQSLLDMCKICKKLKEVSITGCGSSHNFDAFSYAAYEAVSRLPLLESLYISYMTYDDSVLEVIATHARSLKLLECRGCPSISEFGIAKILAKCEKLEHLDLSGSRINCNALKDAALAVGARKDKTPLVMFVGGTLITQEEKNEVNQPRLKVDMSDRSKHHLRPDFNDEIYFNMMMGDDDYDYYDPDSDYSLDVEEALVNFFLEQY